MVRDNWHRTNRPIPGKPAFGLVLAMTWILGDAAIAVAAPVQSQGVDQHVASSYEMMQQRDGAAVSLQRAVEIATERYPGTVVRANTISRDGRTLHEIRILANGRVRTVLVDAQTGDIR